MDNDNWISELSRPDGVTGEDPTIRALRRAARELQQHPVDEVAYQRLLRRVHAELDAEPPPNMSKHVWWASSVATAAVVLLAVSIHLHVPDPQPQATAPVALLADVAVAEEKMASADQERRQVAAPPLMETAPAAAGRAQLAQPRAEAFAKRAAALPPSLRLGVADPRRAFAEIEEWLAVTPGLHLVEAQMRENQVELSIDCATEAACAARDDWLRLRVVDGELPVGRRIRLMLTTVSAND